MSRVAAVTKQEVASLPPLTRLAFATVCLRRLIDLLPTDNAAIPALLRTADLMDGLASGSISLRPASSHHAAARQWDEIAPFKKRPFRETAGPVAADAIRAADALIGTAWLMTSLAADARAKCDSLFTNNFWRAVTATRRHSPHTLRPDFVRVNVTIPAKSRPTPKPAPKSKAESQKPRGRQSKK